MEETKEIADMCYACRRYELMMCDGKEDGCDGLSPSWEYLSGEREF